jgi:O-antigen/teichoic acid export membrane protein
VRVYGQKFVGNEIIVAILAGNVLALAFGMGIENGLTAIHRPNLIFWSQLIGLIVTLATAVPWILQHGVVGAAWAVVTGTIATTVTKIGLFLHSHRQNPKLA